MAASAVTATAAFTAALQSFLAGSMSGATGTSGTAGARSAAAWAAMNESLPLGDAGAHLQHSAPAAPAAVSGASFGVQASPGVLVSGPGGVTSFVPTTAFPSYGFGMPDFASGGQAHMQYPQQQAAMPAPAYAASNFTTATAAARYAAAQNAVQHTAALHSAAVHAALAASSGYAAAHALPHPQGGAFGTRTGVPSAEPDAPVLRGGRKHDIISDADPEDLADPGLDALVGDILGD